MSEDFPKDNDHLSVYACSSPARLNAILAHKNPGNLRRLERVFDVVLKTSPSEFFIESVCAQKRNDCLRFFENADRFCDEFKRVPEQTDFESLITAVTHNQTDLFRTFYDERITVSPRKRDITVRTEAQLRYVRQMREKEIVFGIGPAGTGKTYLAMAMAVHALLAGEVQRLIFTRPAREAGESLGFLPGTLEEKILPYLRPLYDALYEMIDPEEVQLLTEKKLIEVAPLAFMRGRTLNRAFIILDEAQNTTSEQMLMFLTRIGFESRCVITGDPSQNDLPASQHSGLLCARERLFNMDEIGFTQFNSTDVVRHALVEKIIDAWGGR